MQALLKTEPEEEDDEIIDIVTVTPPCQKLKVKEEEQETDVGPKFFIPCMSSQFVSETAQQVWNDPQKLMKVTCYVSSLGNTCHVYLSLSDWGNVSAGGNGEECVCSSNRSHDFEGQLELMENSHFTVTDNNLGIIIKQRV